MTILEGLRERGTDVRATEYFTEVQHTLNHSIQLEEYRTCALPTQDNKLRKISLHNTTAHKYITSIDTLFDTDVEKRETYQKCVDLCPTILGEIQQRYDFTHVDIINIQKDIYTLYTT